jgi:hypothetical protein
MSNFDDCVSCGARITLAPPVAGRCVACAEPFSRSFLEHAATTSSQYDSTCRRLAFQVLQTQEQLATALQQCAKGAAEVDTKAKAAKAWEDLYNERNRLWRAAGDKLDAIGSLLERNGCDCDCEHHWEEHGDECDLCLACQISAAVGSWDRRTNDRNP